MEESTVLNVEELAPRKRDRAGPGLPPPMPTVVDTPDTAFRDRMVAVFQWLAWCLAARAIFLVSILGAFVLSVMAMLDGKAESLYVVIGYSMFTVIPAAILEFRRNAS